MSLHSLAPIRPRLAAMSYFGRMAADREGVDPPEWALQTIPEVTVVGP
jgi:hypothetical protein